MEHVGEKIELAPRITLVRATPADVDTYTDLEKSVGNSKTYSPMTTTEEARAELQKITVFFIKEGDEIVGNISYEIKDPDHAYIDGLLVKPSYQGRGIGRAAMLKILEELKGMQRIDLVTHPDNLRAMKLYESLGFTAGERIENYFGDGEPRIIMFRETRE